MKTGVVSVSFRSLDPEQIINQSAKAQLECIEWGSDVHARCDDIPALHKIAAAQKDAGLYCCSYGTYFRLGTDSIDSLEQYIKAAKILGTDILRLWCGSKSTDEYTTDEKELLFADCKKAAETAQAHSVKLCLECHRNTYTETKEGALELMEKVASPAFRMYWQPNQNRSIQENIEYAALLAPYIEHIHVFQWRGTNRYPLSDGTEEWRDYLGSIGGDHTLLLEFMPDDDICSLACEADSLRTILSR